MAFGLALVLLLVWLDWPSPRAPRPRPERPADPIDTPRARSAEPARSTARGVAVLGVNEGISIPDDPLSRLSGAGRGALVRRVAMLRSIGAGAVRANSHTWPHLNFHEWKGRFDDVDSFVQIAGAAGLDAVMVIGPWPGSRTATFTDHYVPDDLAGYAAWVQAVVERYDGDGVDDMPGLERPVAAWEVDNEPDQHNAVAARERGGGRPLVAGADDRGPGDEPGGDEPGGDGPGGPGGPAPGGAGEAGGGGSFETPEEYATVLIRTAAAIRAADPGALVLSGGIYRAASPRGRRYLEAVLAVPGAREAIGALSLHCYFVADNLDAVTRTMNTARALAPDLPVWITETSVPSTGDQPWVDEEWQARQVAGVIGAFLAEGADRVFWHTLSDPASRAAGPGGFVSNSLFASQRDDTVTTTAEKPAAEVYRRLAAHLAGLDPAGFVEVSASGGRLLQTDAGWLAFEGEPVLPRGAGTVEDLLTGYVEADGRTALAPAWIAR